MRNRRQHESIAIAVKMLQESTVTGYQIEKDTGLSEASVSNWRRGKYAPTFSNASILIDYLSESAPIDSKLVMPIVQRAGRPYFPIDFVRGYDIITSISSLENQEFISVEPFNKRNVIWCNLYSHSMEPIIGSGDKIAIEEVNKDEISYGRVYAVATNTGIRTVKWVSRSPVRGCIRLVPENKESKFGDYQDFELKSISKIFEVLGSIRVL